VYAIDNAGTVELAVSNSRIAAEGSLVTTTAEGGAGGADTAHTLYSTNARSNVPARLIGRIKSTQTVAGTWALAPSEISLTPFGTQAPRSEVRLHTSAGVGSTNTAIRRYSTVVKNIGTAITYASSATLGDSFTINEDGIYSIAVTDGATDAGDASIAGISLNSTQLTTSVYGIAGADRLSWNGTRYNAAMSVYTGTGAQASWTGFLRAGDVIRSHTQTSFTPDTAADCSFTIAKVSH
jgi:hypothetical protein